MRKTVLSLIFILTIPVLYAQTKKLNISGEVNATLGYKYAFVYDMSSKIQYVKPIINNHFTFLFDRPSHLENKRGIIFLSIDSTKNHREVSDFRSIFFEDNMVIQVTGELIAATVKGGILNREFDEMMTSVHNRDGLKFFSEHLNSPVSLMFLESLFSIKNSLPITEEEFKNYFTSLSKEIKESEDGKKFEAKISTP